MSVGKIGKHWCYSLSAGLCLAIWVLIPAGCVRMNVLPKPYAGLTAPESEPRPVNRLDVPHEKDPTKIYRVGARDILRVDVRKDPTLTLKDGYIVTDEGNILLPFIGPVQVANLTTVEIEEKLNKVLSEYIKEPDAKVGVQVYNSKMVNVMGQVNKPGQVVMHADMLTLQEAILAAGLPTNEAAIQRTRVITPDMENPVVRKIDLTDILYKGRMAENILLKPNDIVYVPARYSINLTQMISELIRPADEIYSFQYRANFNSNYNNGNSSNNSSNNNNNNKGFLGF